MPSSSEYVASYSPVSNNFSMLAMSPILAICMMSFWAASPGMLPSSTSLFSFGVAVSDFEGGCVGAPFVDGVPDASCCCAIVGCGRRYARAMTSKVTRYGDFVSDVGLGNQESITG